MNRTRGVYFIIGIGSITNYRLDIENAIATCEIKDCKSTKEQKPAKEDKYDQLEKLKKLFDKGILTEEEYQKEKNKLLNP